ncbi:hypothetical protein DMC61_13460 [Amycolatopsis sp. WAC 04169]|uniref:alpha/beta hydrolase family protein n=1 Tax=Amycolatopsis sp. WAC 04169 TaxID=2203197 RepID=UPI000F7A1061|nr:prolyl oligopeptidase family serine peptidase [Amycolatopsis sp. WAC 04169]RSN31172.1 hypothetical protein DMC61_13460 [Amycolatopsis sp. WAC 04169]
MPASHPNGDGSLSVLTTLPGRPSLSAHRDDLGDWCGLDLDPALAGLAVDRAEPLSVAVRFSDGEEWHPPVSRMTGFGYAWHPDLPLLAGLAHGPGGLHPWIADCAARTVTELAEIRIAASLTTFGNAGGAPLCWLDRDRLLVLCPEIREETEAAAATEPLVYDAAGPGYVSFEPGIEALHAAAGARLFELDLTSGTGRPLLPDSLLVRHLERGTDGSVLVDHVSGLRPSTRAGTGAQRLAWAVGRLTEAGLEPLEDSAALRQPRPRPVRPSRTPRAGSVEEVVTIPTGFHDAVLTVSPPGAVDATVLWLRATSGPLRAELPGPNGFVGADSRQAVLDLPLHWPGDVTLEQLHGQLERAIGASVEHLGDRVVVGGHSFGATLALYALAHFPALAAGIAQSGCYNRTRVCGGFQYEKRPYWAVPEIYHAFSALLFADRIRRPVLIAHGLDDANPATHPDQAVEFYQGLVAAGGEARLALFPCEGHTFRYRETHDRLQEIQTAWLANVLERTPALR